jgi:importin subunit beta-1
MGIIRQLIMTILTRMETLLGMANQLLGVDDRNNWNELQGNFCSIISVSIAPLMGSAPL